MNKCYSYPLPWGQHLRASSPLTLHPMLLSAHLSLHLDIASRSPSFVVHLPVFRLSISWLYPPLRGFNSHQPGESQSTWIYSGLLGVTHNLRTANPRGFVTPDPQNLLQRAQCSSCKIHLNSITQRCSRRISTKFMGSTPTTLRILLWFFKRSKHD